ADDWDELIPLGSKEAKSGNADALFELFSLGVATSRDSWAWNHNSVIIEQNMRRFIGKYNEHVFALKAAGNVKDMDRFVKHDDGEINWSENLKNFLRRGLTISFDALSLRRAQYRPFCMQSLYFDQYCNARRYQLPRIFPLPETENAVVCVSGIGSSKPFQALASDSIPCLDILEKTQCFPLYTYDTDGSNRRDSITDWGLEQFTSHYNDSSITKLDIFHYVYGILHDSAYREKYAANLKRELPRIPFAKDFWSVANIGKRLMDIHVHYEDQPEYSLTEEWTLPKGYLHPYGLPVTSVEQVPERDRYKVTKMKRDKKDPTRLIVNEFLTLTGIPTNVDEYKLGNRSALDWIVDQYQISTDKRSGITNNPNREDDPTYIVRLIKKVVTVSVETVGLVKTLIP
ncbi:MAG: hypothetical protein RLZZ273_846, partial [Bacteroidota bacterium]